ncbi:MAG: hypothetical protein LBE13_18970, partial [Bacteroidales bacterium]|nr:hypothetical protein [Bacteroidales bacterium]
MKKILLILTAALCLCAINKTMAQTDTTGSCTWTLSTDTLTISGTGAMGDYTSGGAPWYSYRTNIKVLLIQHGVTTIGSYAFYGCNALTEISVKALNPPSIGDSNVFDNVPTTIPIHVPCGSMSAYQSASGWSRFTNITGDVFLRGSVSFQEDLSNCKPLQVTFHPLLEQEYSGFHPDSIAIHVGTGEVLVNQGDYFGLTRARRYIYQNAGAYLPVYFFYKTVQVSGKDETCIVQINAEDSIYVVDITPDFETETLYFPKTPITFTNTSTWIPNYLGDTSVTMTWDMGNGDSSLNYNGETQYDTMGIYPVKLSVQVLRCIREKEVNIEVMMTQVVVSVNDSVMGTVIGSGNYAKNTTVIIEAMPNMNYRFVQWHDGDTANPRTITVTQDTIFTAVFEIIKYELSLNMNDTSRGTVSGGGIYVVNTITTISASPHAGYRFVSWSDGNKDSIRTITVIQDTAFVAIFGKENMYYVYAIPNNPTMGNVIGSDDYQKSNEPRSPIFKREYAAKSLASIEAIPNPNHRFAHWNDSITDNPREFTVVSDTIFMAIFEEITIGITDLETSTISVYPNPANDYVRIVLPDNVDRAVF